MASLALLLAPLADAVIDPIPVIWVTKTYTASRCLPRLLPLAVCRSCGPRQRKRHRFRCCNHGARDCCRQLVRFSTALCRN
jgi:hypothetical protein